MVTHSEVILDEALDNNLTLLLEGRADDLARKDEIRDSLKHFGAEHYVKARERGYVLYVEGGTDVDILRALAIRLDHPVAALWDERINSFYVQNNYPIQDVDAELERVEGGFGITPRQHFNGLRNLLLDLRGLAILDNDGQNRQNRDEGALKIRYWRRYEAENYFITPEVLRNYALSRFPAEDLFADATRRAIDEALADVVRTLVFDGSNQDLQDWLQSSAGAARLIWEAKTERRKLSNLAEEFFRLLSQKQYMPMLLRKGELHQLVPFVPFETIPAEVTQKLDLLAELFRNAPKHEEVDAPAAGDEPESGETQADIDEQAS
jgi:hypothetical protein